jgi:hypothetical protein
MRLHATITHCSSLLLVLCLCLPLAACGGDLTEAELLAEPESSEAALIYDTDISNTINTTTTTKYIPLLGCPPSDAFTCPANYTKVASGTYKLGTRYCSKYTCEAPQCPTGGPTSCPAGYKLLTATYTYKGLECTTTGCAKASCPTYKTPTCSTYLSTYPPVILKEYKLVSVPIRYKVYLGVKDNQELYGELVCQQYACSNAHCDDNLSSQSVMCAEGYSRVAEAYVHQSKHLCYDWSCKKDEG